MSKEKETQPMNIRKLDRDDTDAAFACRLRALETEPDAFVTTAAEERAHGPLSMRARLERAPEQGAVFGALDGGRVVGLVGVTKGERPKTAHKATISSMFVEPSHRGCGVGGRLLDLAIAHARDVLGSRAVYLSLEAGNASAKALYASRGFRVWGTEPGAMRDGERMFDEDHMVLEI